METPASRLLHDLIHDEFAAFKSEFLRKPEVLYLGKREIEALLRSYLWDTDLVIAEYLGMAVIPVDLPNYFRIGYEKEKEENHPSGTGPQERESTLYEPIFENINLILDGGK